MLSPVSVNIKSTRKLKCQVRSQAATTVRWSNKINQKWTAEYENSSLKDGAMNYLQTRLLSLKPKASEVINSLKCTLAGERLQCNTEFICSSSYNFNARISKSSSIEVHFLLGKSLAVTGFSSCLITLPVFSKGQIIKSSNLPFI